MKTRGHFDRRRLEWHQQYLRELERFTSWCAAEKVPFKWAMIRAMHGFMRHRPGGRGRGKPPSCVVCLEADATAEVNGPRGPWPSMSAAARDLHVWPNAVFSAIEHGSRCKGLKLALEALPLRADEDDE